MSVLIKGMKMPTSCRACLYSRIDIKNVYWCVLTEKDLPCDCPIIELPPHGRLIDADALLEINNPIGKMMVYGGEYVYSRSEIENAPTILEAEEEEQ